MRCPFCRAHIEGYVNVGSAPNADADDPDLEGANVAAAQAAATRALQAESARGLGARAGRAHAELSCYPP